MAKLTPKISLTGPMAYRIRFIGRLQGGWAEWPEGMTITVDRMADGDPVTTLAGVCSDQAALHGILATVYSLGFPLLSVEPFDDISKYRIRFLGCLEEDWAGRPEGMAITVDRSADGTPVTTLAGVCEGQSGLHGILESIYALGFPLLSVESVD